jgi:hypothetical protein
MPALNRNPIADTMAHVLVSPNEQDRNGEPANLVDGLFAIARAIHRLADGLGRLSDTLKPAQHFSQGDDPYAE